MNWNTRPCKIGRSADRFQRTALSILLCLPFALLLTASCSDSGSKKEVVLYTSLNEPTASAVLKIFEERTGIRVILRTDTERDKTVGLVAALLEERSNPQADVFWNSEVANTVRLKEAEVLEALTPPPAGHEEIPARYKDPELVWFGFAARARVLMVNTDLVPVEERPTSIRDILDPKWAGRTGIVRPVTGTTLTHVTALFELWGDETTNAFLDQVQAAKVNLPPGNGRLARLVGEGALAFGLTDSSDYRLVKNEGFPVDAIYPDQDSLGTLVLPNTVARVRGGPNPEHARALIEFLLSKDAEEILAFHPRGHIPLKPGVKHPPEVLLPGEFKEMTTDFTRVGLRVASVLDAMNNRFK
ncbi:MAG TPA: extracellular solute-binding protein [Planctomycetota bacterium]|nr:extracellular solute-binding protein [Planctomycetota bacterium]